MRTCLFQDHLLGQDSHNYDDDHKDNNDIDHDALEDDDDDASLCTEGDVHWAGWVESTRRVGCPFPLRLPPLDPEERGLGWW